MEGKRGEPGFGNNKNLLFWGGNGFTHVDSARPVAGAGFCKAQILLQNLIIDFETCPNYKKLT